MLFVSDTPMSSPHPHVLATPPCPHHTPMSSPHPHVHITPPCPRHFPISLVTFTCPHLINACPSDTPIVLTTLPCPEPQTHGRLTIKPMLLPDPHGSCTSARIVLAPLPMCSTIVWVAPVHIELYGLPSARIVLGNVTVHRIYGLPSASNCMGCPVLELYGLPSARIVWVVQCSNCMGCPVLELYGLPSARIV